MVTTVDYYGRWTPLATAEEYEKMEAKDMSNMDIIASAVLKLAKETGYTIQTDLENVSEMVLCAIETYEEEHPDEDFWTDGGEGWSEGTTVEQKVREVILMTGNIKDFDYRG